MISHEAPRIFVEPWLYIVAQNDRSLFSEAKAWYRYMGMLCGSCKGYDIPSSFSVKADHRRHGIESLAICLPWGGDMGFKRVPLLQQLLRNPRQPFSIE